jgi:hypothetical protein
MTRVVRSKDCGNSPKNQLVEDLAVALSTGDRGTVARLVTDDAQWRVIGGNTLRGREAVLQAIEHVDRGSIVMLTVWHVITHGKSGAVNGTIQNADGTREFCDVFEFESAKGTSISQVTSYRIDT